MSIVQEALKKAQGKIAPEPARAGVKSGSGPIALLIIFVVLLGFTIRQFSTASKAAEAIYKPISSIDAKSGDMPVAEPYTALESPIMKGGNKKPFILNGIMELVDGPRAIVNNVIVGIGDIIGGATVKKIDKEQVVLQKEDATVTLGME